MLGNDYDEVCGVLAKIREHLIGKYDYDWAGMCSSPHEVALNAHDYIQKLEARVKSLEAKINCHNWCSNERDAIKL